MAKRFATLLAASGNISSGSNAVTLSVLVSSGACCNVLLLRIEFGVIPDQFRKNLVKKGGKNHAQKKSRAEPSG